jgi:hypothetical protein
MMTHHALHEPDVGGRVANAGKIRRLAHRDRARRLPGRTGLNDRRDRFRSGGACRRQRDGDEDYPGGSRFQPHSAWNGHDCPVSRKVSQDRQKPVQWYFDDALSDRILSDPRYARSARRDTYNASDGIYRNGGSQLMLAPTRTTDGLQASFTIGLDLSDREAARPDGRGVGGRGGRRGAPPGSRGA